MTEATIHDITHPGWRDEHIARQKAEIERLAATEMRLTAENEKLKLAIEWALGAKPDSGGVWFGDNRDNDAEKARKAPYWWRTHLRKLAGFPSFAYDKERRTIVQTHEQIVVPK